MVDAGRVDDARRRVEALAVERRGGHVQRLVVEGRGERALLEVAADDRHRVDRGDRRHAQAAQRRDQPAARRVRERQVVDRRREDVGDLLRDQLLGRGHADVDRLAEAADRRAGLLAERRVRLVADHELVRVREISSTWRANQAYVWIVIGFCRAATSARQHRVLKRSA